MAIVAYVKRFCDEIPVEQKDMAGALALREQYGADVVRIEVDGEAHVEPAELPTVEEIEAIEAGEG